MSMGLKVWDSGGKLIVDVFHNFARYYGYVSTIANPPFNPSGAACISNQVFTGSSFFFSIPEMADDGKWIIIRRSTPAPPGSLTVAVGGFTVNVNPNVRYIGPVPPYFTVAYVLGFDIYRVF